MEPLKGRLHALPLRQAFYLYVCATFLAVVLLSALIVWLCSAMQSRLLPASDEVTLTIWETFDDGRVNKHAFRLTMGEIPGKLPFLIGVGVEGDTVQHAEYAVSAIERSVSTLSPKRQLLYRASEIAMLAGPLCLSFGGILLCGVLFYQRKLKRPIETLSQATARISRQDLDFQITSDSGDELGRLCGSFEQMRVALRESYQALWATLEERKQLQASVAHDLRNPIAIIEGHAEYLQINLGKGGLKRDKLAAIVGNIQQAAKRLESYTESMGAINRWEALEVQREELPFDSLYVNLVADLSIIAAGAGVALVCKNGVGDRRICLDPKLLYRILENLLGNAARFARREIRLSFFASPDGLQVLVEDDGPGFPQAVLNAPRRYAPSGEGSGPHGGLGLVICRILCEKHGGSLRLSNGAQGGARVQVSLLS